MGQYINPTVPFDGTNGDDSITFNALPVGPSGSSVNALGGYDSLLVQISDPYPINFDVSDEFNAGYFNVGFRYGPFLSTLSVLNVENVDLRGTANDDSFGLRIGPNSSSLTVNMDGGAGQDLLRFVWNQMTTGLSFVANGSTITSTFGTFSNFETFYIFAGSGNDTITTAGGDDQVFSGGGIDTVSTGGGSDYIQFESTGGSIAAGDGDDTILLSEAPTSSLSVDGGAGQDFLYLEWFNMTAGMSFVVNGATITSNVGSFANLERFTILAGSGSDTITTGGADDSISAGAGNDTVSGGGGNDGISGDAGNDSINGDAGDDNLSGGIGDDNVIGGDGNDTLYGDSNQISSAGDGNDQLSGGVGNDTIYGGGGNDWIDGGANDDSLTGGKGADQIFGGDGNDRLFGYGESSYGPPDDGSPDNLVGGAGDDVIYAGHGDSVDGGSGIDRLEFNGFGAATGITADFSQLKNGGTITVGGATITGIEFVTGISGSNYNDTLVAGAVPGIDGIFLSGWGGDDVLTGSTGTDYIYGGDGNDIINGGVGKNPAVSPSGDRLMGEAGNDVINIGADGANAYGGTGNDIINGGSAADEMWGEADDDRLNGGGGNDGINGGDGSDILTGGAGQDTLIGGLGADTFRDTAAGLNGDTIADFAPGDTIIITNANLSTFSFSILGNVLTYTGGSLTLGSPVDGTIVASVATGGGVQLQVKVPPLGTIDQIADQLTSGYWNENPHRWNVTQGGSLTVNITGLDSTEQLLARAALAQWAGVLGINFQEVTGGAQIVFEHNEEPGGPGAYTDSNWSNGFLSFARVHISSSWLSTYGSSLSSYSFQTYVHEIGHALGLGHAGDYNFTASFLDDALFLNDAWSTSVMSYFDQTESIYFNNLNFTKLFVGTPMVADILAIQQLYGLSTNTRNGDTTYGYNTNAGAVYDPTLTSLAFTIFDTGGIDTLDYSGVYAAQRINLNPEAYSSVRGSIGNLAIARGTIIENAIGGYGPDVIIGNAVDNVLTGGDSFDTLTGGAGNDTFRDTINGHYGDTITDFGAGDRIVFTDADINTFTFSFSGNSLIYTGGSLTLSAPVTGTVIARQAVGGGVELSIAANLPDNDFNGDGRSDILWRHDSGVVIQWLGQPNGSFAYDPNISYALPTDWSMAGTGDFNGDGRFDILWRHTSGNLIEWLGQANGTLASNPAANSTLATNWQVTGVADFNGDGRDDVLWRNDTGLVMEWLGQANGTFTANPKTYQMPTDWTLAAANDFTGDGRADILWRHSSGVVIEWVGQADGSFAWDPNVSYALPTDWTMAVTGDFNNDGRTDIIWRHNPSGNVIEWLGQANGSFADNPAAANSMPTSWHINGVGDFNGDGRDDILWRNDNGTLTDWLGQANGSFVQSPANYAMPTTWHVQPDDLWV